MIEKAIYKLLKDGAIVGSRIYPLTLPQNATLPAMSYQIISRDIKYTHQGDYDVATIRLQINVYAETHDALVSLIESVRGVLSGYKGTSSSVVIESCFEQNLRIDRQYELGIYTGIIDYMITYQL